MSASPGRLVFTGGMGPGNADPVLRHRLAHVHWIGGASGAGKSTIGRRLADRRAMRLYASDEAMPDHGGRITPHDAPFLGMFQAMDMDERWVNRSPQAMLDTFHWFRGEGFGLIVEDLLRLPAERGVIAEGFRLLPDLVKPLLAAPDQAVWLLPTPRFRRAALEGRGSLWEIARKTSDPETALGNLLERDRMFTDRLREEVRRLGLTAIEVDTQLDEDDLTSLVAEAFGIKRAEEA